MRGRTRMKMDADNCVSRIYGRYGDETQASSMLSQNPCSLIRSSWAAVQTNHFLRFPFFFFATVSAAGTVCSGSEKSLTSASSSWILCIVCETLAMMRDF